MNIYAIKYTKKRISLLIFAVQALRTAVLKVICQLDICKVSKVKTVEGARHMN